MVTPQFNWGFESEPDAHRGRTYASRRARQDAGRVDVRSTACVIRAAISATTISGGNSATRAGALPTSLPYFKRSKPTIAARTSITAATVR